MEERGGRREEGTGVRIHNRILQTQSDYTHSVVAFLPGINMIPSETVHVVPLNCTVMHSV